MRLVAVLLVALLASCADSPDESAAPAPATGTPMSQRGIYLALGDSLAVGVGATRPAETGYVGVLARALSSNGTTPVIQSHRNLAISGETSQSMIRGGQLDDAIALIARADPPVTLVTLDIGGNDLLALLRTPECSTDPEGEACLALLDETLVVFEENFRHILGRLRDALAEHAPDARIAVMTYYNPFSGTGVQYEAAGDLALVGADGDVDCDARSGENAGINDIIVCVGQELGAVPVDVRPPFTGRGLELTQIAFQDVHANDRGYLVMADAFVAALRDGG
jgi:lysophospholipase L1-like esterase